MKLKSTCFWCLARCQQHPLPCGHSICDACAEKYGTAFEGAEYEYTIDRCISCQEPFCLKIKLKPPTAGVRVLSIDGGGLRGIAPLVGLSLMQKELGPELPIQSLVDFFIGTSSGMHVLSCGRVDMLTLHQTGGLVALDLGICQHDVEDSKESYRLIKHYFEQQEKGGSGLRRWVNALASDGLYDVKSLEDIFKSRFGSLRMFSSPRTKVSGWKVAVTSSTIDKGSPVLITNYHSETPAGRNHGTITTCSPVCSRGD